MSISDEDFDEIIKRMIFKKSRYKVTKWRRPR